MNKWTKKQVVGAVLGGLAIAAVFGFCIMSVQDAARLYLEQVK